MNLPAKIPELKFSEDELLDIGNLAAANYTAEDVALYFNIPKDIFLSVFNDKNSIVRTAYDSGRLAKRFAIINKQADLAQGGNITAAQIYLKESDTIRIENIRNHCLFI